MQVLQELRLRDAGNGAEKELALASGVLVVGAVVWLYACGFGHIGYDFRGHLEGAHAVAAGHNPYAVLLQQTPDTRPGSAGLQAHGYVYPPLLATILAVPVRLGIADGPSGCSGISPTRPSSSGWAAS